MLYLAQEEAHNPIVPLLEEVVVGTVAFALLAYVLMKFVFPRMEQTFHARVEAIEGGIKRAEEAQVEANKLLEQYRQQLAEARAEGITGGNDTRLRDGYNPNIVAIRSLEKPVIAAVNGVAAGAGLSLAAACDLRIASTRARFVPAFIELGLVPDSGGSMFLPQILGYPRAFMWLTSGRRVDAEEALAWGLVGEVVEPEQLMARAHQVAGDLAGKPGNGVGRTKRLLARALGSALAEHLELEVQLQTSATSTAEYARAVEAFLDGRK